MAARTGRAAMLGTLATALAGAVTWWLLRSAVTGWPGWGTVEVGSGFAFLTTGVAGLVAGWATLLLALATVTLVTQVRAGGTTRPDDQEDGAAGRRMSGRVAAGLLLAASVSIAPAAAAAPPTAAQVSVSAAAPGAAGETAGPSWAGQAPDGPGGPTGDPASDDSAVPVPGWTPTVSSEARPPRPPAGEVSLVSTMGMGTVPDQDEVVVHRGDSLWDIAARHLGEHATDQDVAEAWPRWYAANRDVIGGDPDLIHPGQRLVVPAHGGAR